MPISTDWNLLFYQADTIKFTVNENEGLDTDALLIAWIRWSRSKSICNDKYDGGSSNYPYLNQRKGIIYPYTCWIASHTQEMLLLVGVP